MGECVQLVQLVYNLLYNLVGITIQLVQLVIIKKVNLMLFLYSHKLYKLYGISHQVVQPVVQQVVQVVHYFP